MKDNTVMNPQTTEPEIAGFAKLAEFVDSLELRDSDDRQAALIEVLHEAQEIFGHLPEHVQEFVAEKLRLPLSQVFGVISFYHYFTTKRRGKYQINFCLGTACFVRGAEKIIERFRELLGIEMGDMTPDGKFSLGTLRCVGACSLAPVMMVNKKVYGRVTPDQADTIIAEFD